MSVASSRGHRPSGLVQSLRKEALTIPDRFWLKDAQFAKVSPHLPTGMRSKSWVDDPRANSGIINELRSGGRWIDAPAGIWAKKLLYNRYVRRKIKGIWVELFETLEAAEIRGSRFSSTRRWSRPTTRRVPVRRERAHAIGR